MTRQRAEKIVIKLHVPLILSNSIHFNQKEKLTLHNEGQGIRQFPPINLTGAKKSAQSNDENNIVQTLCNVII